MNLLSTFELIDTVNIYFFNSLNFKDGGCVGDNFLKVLFSSGGNIFFKTALFL